MRRSSNASVRASWAAFSGVMGDMKAGLGIRDGDGKIGRDRWMDGMDGPVTDGMGWDGTGCLWFSGACLYLFCLVVYGFLRFLLAGHRGLLISLTNFLTFAEVGLGSGRT